jgi:hypothetical protein
MAVFTRRFLRGWWRRALRRRVLFTALDKEERAYMYLTMRVLDEVRSERVGRMIVKILVKLREALKDPFVRMMEDYGVGRAWAMSRTAVAWGYRAAREWAGDVGFVRYLTVHGLNGPSGWGV